MLMPWYRGVARERRVSSVEWLLLMATPWCPFTFFEAPSTQRRAVTLMVRSAGGGQSGRWEVVETW
jgi:hypothetical protein